MISTDFVLNQPLTGYWKFRFERNYFKFPKDPRNFDSDACVNAFQAMDNVHKVICSLVVTPVITLAATFTGSSTYTVQFKSFPTLPHQNNIYQIMGTQTSARSTAHAENDAVIIGSWSGTALLSSV